MIPTPSQTNQQSPARQKARIICIADYLYWQWRYEQAQAKQAWEKQQKGRGGRRA